MPKQITQAELRTVLSDESALNRRMMSIRNRMCRGAIVELGELGARIEPFDKDENPEISSYSNMGLMVGDANYINRLEDAIRRDEAKNPRPSNLVMIRSSESLEVANA